ncbi:UNVERIFIED_CONTAM: hypothetical protein PYX00_008149 [Menopon gallinae]|uniref:CREG-like beta-barrel domain-containing protein n=1 Tax=Menopon gallinae TaxID=328185 RepID=A0AAW2HMJ1_9NEOP
MLKFALILLVFGTVCNSISQAYDHREYESTGVRIEAPPERREEFSHEEKHHKKYYKELEDKYEKDGKYYKHKKYYGDEKRKYGKDFEDSPKNGKYSKYEKKQNDYDYPGRSKEVNHHDKTGPYEKKHTKEAYHSEQEIVEDEVTPVSLHHDIDVNYIGNRNELSSDAEFISKEGHVKVHKKENMQNGYEFEKKPKVNFYKNLKEIDLMTVPNGNNSALVARYVLHNVDWVAIGTISANIKIKGLPFVNVISVSDGPVNKGSGVPFFYMTPKDFSSIDIEKDNRCSITATLAQTNFCKEKNLDPESPLCARLILSGKVKRVKPGTDEENFAKTALFSRHPEMESWPADHDWFFAKLKIKQIILIDHFGGATYVNIQDYFNADNK